MSGQESESQPSYSIQFTPAAARDFRRLTDNIKTRLQPAIDNLTHNPRPSGVVKLSGTIDVYRIRVGDYRILYQIQDDVLVVVVVKVGHRREVYR